MIYDDFLPSGSCRTNSASAPMDIETIGAHLATDPQGRLVVAYRDGLAFLNDRLETGESYEV